MILFLKTSFSTKFRHRSPLIFIDNAYEFIPRLHQIDEITNDSSFFHEGIEIVRFGNTAAI